MKHARAEACFCVSLRVIPTRICLKWGLCQMFSVFGWLASFLRITNSNYWYLHDLYLKMSNKSCHLCVATCDNANNWKSQQTNNWEQQLTSQAIYIYIYLNYARNDNQLTCHDNQHTLTINMPWQSTCNENQHTITNNIHAIAMYIAMTNNICDDNQQPPPTKTKTN